MITGVQLIDQSLVNSHYLTLFIPGFFGCRCTGGGGVCLHPVAPLTFKLDDNNFAQNYFGVTSIFRSRKNRDQIDIDVTMMSPLL